MDISAFNSLSIEHKACNVKLNCKMVLLSEGVIMHSTLLIECLNLYKNVW